MASLHVDLLELGSPWEWGAVLSGRGGGLRRGGGAEEPGQERSIPVGWTMQTWQESGSATRQARG